MFKNGQTILFTGDSITDCGRARPLGEGAGLGCGYVAFVESLLASCMPQRQLRIINTGIGGNRVIDLEARWVEDVEQYRPDWLSVLIGINDVWRQFDDADNPTQVLPAKYEKVYRRLLERIRPDLEGLVLMSPYLIEQDKTDPMRMRMLEYGSIVEGIARDYDALYIDLQMVFDNYLAFRPAATLCDDRIHPNQVGHMLIATALLKAVGFSCCESAGGA